MTFNLDETAVFFDHTKQTAARPKDAKDIPVRSFGFEKQRATAVFCASATREEKLPCVMIKKAPVPDKVPAAVNNNVTELRMGSQWMNASSFIEYIKLLFPDPVAPNTVLLVFDSPRCHTAKDVIEYLTSRGILFAIIPGGMTEFCQPADFGRFAQLKNQLSNSIDNWKSAGPFELTRGV